MTVFYNYHIILSIIWFNVYVKIQKNYKKRDVVINYIIFLIKVIERLGRNNGIFTKLSNRECCLAKIIRLRNVKKFYLLLIKFLIY